MKMDRRTLLVSLCALAGTALFRTGDLFAASSRNTLSSGGFYIAKAGDKMMLPEKPKHKDCVHIVVDKNSVRTPAKIYSHTAKIAGDKDSLTLDSLAIFRMVFDKPTNNWILT